MIDQIQQDMKTALKAKEKEKLSTIRMLLADIKKKSIDQKKELTSDEIIAVIKKAIKSRQDSIKMYEDAGRQELADKEKNEVAILTVYLPEELNDDQIQEIVQKAIQSTGATSKKEMGLVIKTVMNEYASQVDGKKVQQIVNTLLN